MRHGEVDIVSRSGSHLYFVEVKTRRARSRRFGGALGALSTKKQRSMGRVAEVFIARQQLFDLQPHFALVTVDVDGERSQLRFIPDPFDA